MEKDNVLFKHRNPVLLDLVRSHESSEKQGHLGASSSIQTISLLSSMHIMFSVKLCCEYLDPFHII